MKKAFLILVLLFTATGLFAQSLDDLINHFSKEYNISDRSEVYYQIVLASDGCRIKINNISVELYKYDTNNPEYKTYIEGAKAMANLLAESFEIKCYLYVNKSFLLSMNENNLDTEKIVKKFMSF